MPGPPPWLRWVPLAPSACGGDLDATCPSAWQGGTRAINRLSTGYRRALFSNKWAEEWVFLSIIADPSQRAGEEQVHLGLPEVTRKLHLEHSSGQVLEALLAPSSPVPGGPVRFLRGEGRGARAGGCSAEGPRLTPMPQGALVFVSLGPGLLGGSPTRPLCLALSQPPPR